jgi:hypothetical protein
MYSYFFHWIGNSRNLSMIFGGECKNITLWSNRIPSKLYIESKRHQLDKFITLVGGGMAPRKMAYGVPMVSGLQLKALASILLYNSNMNDRVKFDVSSPMLDHWMRSSGKATSCPYKMLTKNHCFCRNITCQYARKDSWSSVFLSENRVRSKEMNSTGPFGWFE